MLTGYWDLLGPILKLLPLSKDCDSRRGETKRERERETRNKQQNAIARGQVLPFMTKDADRL